MNTATNNAVTVRATVNASGFPIYIASSADARGPQSLLSRTTEAAAIEAGAAYLAKHWTRNEDGSWSAT